MTEQIVKNADISADGLYRYWLTRLWDSEAIPLSWIMLNPSTANAEDDDPTIKRCMGFARRLGFGGIAVWNLYAYWATDPKDLKAAGYPAGPLNDERLRFLFEWANDYDQPVVAAWGNNAVPERVEQVLAIPGATKVLRSLGTTNSGAPKHPLARGLHRIPDDAPLVRWPVHLLLQEVSS